MNRINISDKSQCCGCSACVQKCPKRAIRLINDSEGFDYPEIDDSLCVDCGLCLKVCHFKSNDFCPTENYFQYSYCAYNKDKKILEDSSSGGVFWQLVKYILSKKGVVYGAVANGFTVYHRRGSTIEDCIDFRKSKYLQSEIRNTYVEAKNDLLNDRYVLFSGTPCQIAGLYSFLGKDFDRLLTCEVICHGVPSRAAFDKWLIDLGRRFKGKTPIAMVWRDKTNGWGPNYVTYEFNDGSKWSAPSQKSLFQKGFLDNLYLRPSCYNCHYAKLPRIADISLADFWGYDAKLKEKNNNKGLSAIITSTIKGQNTLNEIKDTLIIESVDIEYLKDRSRHVWLHPEINARRNDFFLYLKTHSFTISAKKYLNLSITEKIKLKIRNLIRRILLS